MALNLLKDPLPPEPEPEQPAPDPPTKKGKSTTPSNGSLLDILAGIRKDKGENVVVSGATIPTVGRLSTGIFELDFYLGGGFPCGRYSIIYGPESCLDAETFIQYEVRDQYGCRQNHKGGTLRKLWHRFHGKVMPGKGHYQREKTQFSEFFAPSINEEGRVFQNRIIDVVDAGVRECFRITTESGQHLIATAEHKFFIGTGYVPLSALKAGDDVFVHRNIPFTGQSGVSGDYRKVSFVKHHPYGSAHVVDGKYVYRRVFQSRLLVEALNNGLSLKEFTDRLNTGHLEGLVFLPPELHVHHKDEDFTNNAPDNLVVVEASAHGRLHALKAHNNLRFVVIPDRVTGITSVGLRPTYDVCMEQPFNNFVAQGIVVHNSNKTNLCLKAVAAAQRLPPPNNKAVWVDVEQSFDPYWAAQLGVDPKALFVVKPAYGEEAVDLVDGIIRASDVAILVVDSVAALIANKEVEQSTEKYDIGTSALLIKRMVNKMMIGFGEQAKAGHYPCVILVNQTRFKPGVMFGDPETMPGGEAQKFLSSLRIRVNAKNVVDTATNMVAFKETHVVVKKAKVPVRAVSFKFELCVKAQDDLRVGDTDSFHMVKSHLQALGLLGKSTPNHGYVIKNGAKKLHFNTITQIQEEYQKDATFRMTLQKMVIDHFQDRIIVEEIDYAPKDVTPGKVVQSTAPE